MKAMLFVSFSLIVCLPGLAQPGFPDPTFGNGGKVQTNVDQTRNVTNSVLAQPDGKTVVIGYCTPADYTGYFTLVRYNEDGSLDNDFGLNGIVTTVINGNEDIALSGVVQADGKIIAAGYTWTGTDYDFAMIRYLSDGTRDLTFGANGIVTTDLGGTHDKANRVLLEPDGDILLVGYTGDTGFIDVNMAFARYNANGQLSAGYGVGGVAVVPVSEPGLRESARAAALQPDGKLVAVGYIEVLDPVSNAIDLILAGVRLNADGSLDPTFANGGILKMPIEQRSIGTGVAVDADGRIVVLAETKLAKYGTTDFTIFRLNNAGTVDAGFGINGFTKISFDNSDDTGECIVLQPDKKILVAGYTAVNNGSTVDFALARLDEEGNLDDSFGSGGKVSVDFQGGLDFGGSIALQNDGRIVMAGAATNGADFDFGVVRFENDAALPVKLLSFDAEASDHDVVLTWKTSAETASDRFEVLRSADGLQWNVLDTLEAKHFSSEEAHYLSNDHRPMKGKNFYRLKMIDLDGSFTYSTIVSAYFGYVLAASGLSVYPNPSTGKLKLDRISSDEIVDVRVVNVKGYERAEFKWSGYDLDISQLPNGVYNITVKDKQGRTEHSKVLLAK